MCFRPAAIETGITCPQCGMECPAGAKTCEKRGSALPSAPGGFGAPDIPGQDATDATVRQVASWISGKIEPTISPTIERLEDETGKTFIRVTFSGAEALYSADGRYFIRVGTSNNVMSTSELIMMIIERDRTQRPWDSLPSGRPISDADEEAMRDFFRRGNKANRIAGEFINAEDALGKLDMIAENGALTNAADVRGRFARNARRRQIKSSRPAKRHNRRRCFPRRRHREVRHGYPTHQRGMRQSRRELPL